MTYEDRITIATPEGVDLDLALAGLGSRFTALLVDMLLQIVLLAALWAALYATDTAVGTAVFLVANFLVLFGYDVLFEVFASGRTPGKRWTGIRVVRVTGHPVGFVTSSIRNLLRLVDLLPGLYVVGCISILVTSRNQRLGDLAAGTLVVRERRGADRRPREAPISAARRDQLAVWDVSAVTLEELAAVRRFLERREELTPDARAHLGSTIAERLRPKVAGAPDGLHVEAFLEGLAAAKASRA